MQFIQMTVDLQARRSLRFLLISLILLKTLLINNSKESYQVYDQIVFKNIANGLVIVELYPDIKYQTYVIKDSVVRIPDYLNTTTYETKCNGKVVSIFSEKYKPKILCNSKAAVNLGNGSFDIDTIEIKEEKIDLELILYLSNLDDSIYLKEQINFIESIINKQFFLGLDLKNNLNFINISDTSFSQFLDKNRCDDKKLKTKGFFDENKINIYHGFGSTNFQCKNIIGINEWHFTTLIHELLHSFSLCHYSGKANLMNPVYDKDKYKLCAFQIFRASFSKFSYLANFQDTTFNCMCNWPKCISCGCKESNLVLGRVYTTYSNIPRLSRSPLPELQPKFCSKNFKTSSQECGQQKCYSKDFNDDQKLIISSEEVKFFDSILSNKIDCREIEIFDLNFIESIKLKQKISSRHMTNAIINFLKEKENQIHISTSEIEENIELLGILPEDKTLLEVKYGLRFD